MYCNNFEIIIASSSFIFFNTQSSSRPHKTHNFIILLNKSLFYYRPTRQRKVKFLGRRILHTWDVSTDTNDPRYKTFVGNVLSMVRGEDGDPDATYRIFYQEDNTTINISDLKKDYDEGNLRFHDL